jgi:hypothetical protein
MGKPNTWHSGGQLNQYGMGCVLPLKTIYYKYPDNFMIFDPAGFLNEEDSSYNNVWVIKEGKLVGLKSCWDATITDFGDAVYDTYGRLLNIKKIFDFRNMRIEDKVLHTVLENLDKKSFENEQDRYDAHDKAWEEFEQKWYPIHPNHDEMALGELIECAKLLYERKDSEPLIMNGKVQFDPKNEYLSCIGVIKNTVSKSPDIIKKYMDWLDLSIDRTEIEKILKSALE